MDGEPYDEDRELVRDATSVMVCWWKWVICCLGGPVNDDLDDDDNK